MASKNREVAEPSRPTGLSPFGLPRSTCSSHRDIVEGSAHRLSRHCSFPSLPVGRESMSLGHSGIHLVSGRHELKEIS